MRATISIIVFWGIFSFGCTSTHYFEDNAESYNEINDKTRAQNVEILLMNGQTNKGHYFKAAVDSTRWIEELTLNTNIVPTSEISEIYTKNPKRGAIIGFCAAAGIGFVLAGVLYGGLNEAMDDIPGSDQGYILKYGLPGALISGFVFGVPIGMKVGGKHKFILHISSNSIYKTDKKALRRIYAR